MLFEYSATLDRVVDGDTVWLFVDLGFRMRAHLDFRLHGLNTPEMIGPSRVAGLAAKAELERLLSLGSLRIVTDKADKYGRWLATIFVRTPAGEVNANAALLKGSFAKPYMGEGPKT